MAAKGSGVVVLEALVVVVAELLGRLADELVVHVGVHVDLLLDLLQHLQRLLGLADGGDVLGLQGVVAGLDALRAVEGVVDLGVDAGPGGELLREALPAPARYSRSASSVAFR